MPIHAVFIVIILQYILTSEIVRPAAVLLLVMIVSAKLFSVCLFVCVFPIEMKAAL